jgi:hypothetical protein
MTPVKKKKNDQYRPVLGRQHQTVQGIFPNYGRKQGKKEENRYIFLKQHFNIFKILRYIFIHI